MTRPPASSTSFVYIIRIHQPITTTCHKKSVTCLLRGTERTSSVSVESLEKATCIMSSVSLRNVVFTLTGLIRLIPQSIPPG